MQRVNNDEQIEVRIKKYDDCELWLALENRDMASAFFVYDEDGEVLRNFCIRPDMEEDEHEVFNTLEKAYKEAAYYAEHSI